MERSEALWPGGPRIFYADGVFPPGTDSFALGYFARTKAGERVCDLGCGSGLLGALLLARQPGLRLYNVEMSPEAMALCRRTFAENGWDAVFCQGDLRERSVLPGAGSMDHVVSNPPYFPCGSGAQARDEAMRAARSEERCTLGELCAAAGYLLRWGGRLTMVQRPERLGDALCAMRAAGIEGKRLRMVAQRAECAPSLVLLEGRRGGKSGLTVEPPLVVESDEWARVYFR